MRTLNLNKTKMWKVTQIGVVNKVDVNGFLTGEKVKQFSTPEIIYINIYPSDSEIMEQIFGKDCSLDMIACSNEIVLNEDDLLFLTQPVSNYMKTHTYRVSALKKSLNTFNYGLKARI